MMRAYLCISEKKDLELYKLHSDIGATKFRKMTKLCALGIFDERAAVKARQLALSKENGGGTFEQYDGGIKLRLNISKKECSTQYILSSLKPGICSNFLKTCIRQVLGPQILLKYFLKNPEEVSASAITFMPSKLSFAMQQPARYTPVRRSTSHLSTIQADVEKKEDISTATVLPNRQVEEYVEPETNKIPSPQVAMPAQTIQIQQAPETSEEEEDGFDMLSMLEAML